MKTVEKIMNIWAKITSLVIVGSLIYWIYLIIQLSILQIPTWRIPTYILTAISGLIFYSPFFYYGWVKKPDNHIMKTFTKFMTILYIVAVVFISPIFNGFKLSDIFLITPLALAFLTPLYYYAWR